MNARMTAITLLAVAQIGVAVVPTNGQATSEPNGSVVLDFKVKHGLGAGSNLEMNLGSITKFMSLAPGTVLTLSGPNGPLVTELQSTYGNGNGNPVWNTRKGLLWSISAPSFDSGVAGLPDGMLFMTSATGSISKRALARMQGIAAGDDERVGKPQWLHVDSPSQSFSSEKLFAVTRTDPGTMNTQLLGTFELFDNGTLDFIAPADPVPEPSAWALGAMGSVALLSIYIRRYRRLR